MKVLYVDALSAPQAQTNINGIIRAYQKVSTLETFDYRKMSKEGGGDHLMNCALVEKAVSFQPDLIHLGKSESIIGSSIREIKEQTDACVIHFFGDFRWEPQDWVVDIGQYADWTLLYHKDETLIQKHHDCGIKNIGFWWVGMDPEVMYSRYYVSKRYQVVFMANNISIEGGQKAGQGGNRRDLVRAIATERIHLHLFGHGWEDLIGWPTAHLHPFVNDDGFAIACSEAKITLGINTDKVYMYTSWRRLLNSMGCGAFHLTRYFPGLEEVFENGEDLVWFNSIPEAVELVEYYLAHDGERERIARTGQQEVLAHHTWDHRIAEMFQYRTKYLESIGENVE